MIEFQKQKTTQLLRRLIHHAGSEENSSYHSRISADFIFCARAGHIQTRKMISKKSFIAKCNPQLTWFRPRNILRVMLPGSARNWLKFVNPHEVVHELPRPSFL